MKDEPTIEEELDMPTQIGRCVKCGYRVMSADDYVRMEDGSLACDPCVDSMFSGAPWTGSRQDRDKASSYSAYSPDVSNPRTRPRSEGPA